MMQAECTRKGRGAGRERDIVLGGMFTFRGLNEKGRRKTEIRKKGGGMERKKDERKKKERLK